MQREERAHWSSPVVAVVVAIVVVVVLVSESAEADIENDHQS